MSHTDTTTDSRLPRIAAAVLSVAPVVAASVLGQLATFPNLVPWYAGLQKPGIAPPNWVFGPVWGLLYILMAIACWRILRLPRRAAGRPMALALYSLQLLLNIAWSWMFFAAKSPAFGFINIIPQWLTIVVLIAVLRRIDTTAAWCLAPLAVWVGFAAILNGEVWRLNS